MSDLFPDRIETERLELAIATSETVDPFALYGVANVDAPHVDEVTEYLTWDPYETPKDASDFLRAITEAYEAGETATYAIRPRSGEDGAGELAGITGFEVDWDARTVTFGTWLRKRFWGRGYSGERAAALVELAFDRLDLDAVVVTVQDGNEKSRTAVSRYVEAHGGRYEGLLRNFQTNADGSVADVHRYTITAEEYATATAE